MNYSAQKAPTGYAGSGEGNAAPGLATREKTLLEDHYTRVETQCVAVQDAIIRAKRIADRLLGAQPEPIAKNSETNAIAGPTAIAVRLGDRIDDLVGLTERLHSELSRLERL